MTNIASFLLSYSHKPAAATVSVLKSNKLFQFLQLGLENMLHHDDMVKTLTFLITSTRPNCAHSVCDLHQQKRSHQREESLNFCVNILDILYFMPVLRSDFASSRLV